MLKVVFLHSRCTVNGNIMWGRKVSRYVREWPDCDEAIVQTTNEQINEITLFHKITSHFLSPYKCVFCSDYCSRNISVWQQILKYSHFYKSCTKSLITLIYYLQIYEYCRYVSTFKYCVWESRSKPLRHSVSHSLWSASWVQLTVPCGISFPSTASWKSQVLIFVSG